MRPDFWRSRRNPPLGRRSFLGLGAALTGGFAFSARPGQAETSIAAPPADAPWSQSIGPGVVDRPYGRPADTEAGVIRRNVPWLMAGTESSISFSPLQDLHGIITPNGLFFECYHAGRPDVEPDQEWQRAQLHEPVLSKALTRFTLPWHWDGRPALLESRVIDETGYVQPTITQLRKQRGLNSVYHNDSIQNWQVKPDGSVFDVQLA